MQVDPGATIDALSSAISELLAPPPADRALTPKVAILPAQTNLAGIGGFIGHSDAPLAERIARRLEGEVVVRVFAGSVADLLDAEASVARKLLAASPSLLRRKGILQLQRVAGAPERRLEAVDGIAAPFGQEVRFAVKFEHSPVPVESEGVIEKVPQDLILAGDERSGRLLYATEFATDPIGKDFTPVLGGTEGTAKWEYRPPAGDESGEVLQTGDRRGGEDGTSGDKAGAYLVLNAAVADGALADFVLHAEVRSDAQGGSDGPGGIGLVFRFVDAANFGFFLMEDGLRLFGRRKDSKGFLLDEGSQAAGPLPKNQWLRLRLLAEGDRFELAINEVVALTGSDPNLKEPGSVGLFCRGNPTARFRHLRLTGL